MSFIKALADGREVQRLDWSKNFRDCTRRRCRRALLRQIENLEGCSISRRKADDRVESSDISVIDSDDSVLLQDDFERRGCPCRVFQNSDPVEDHAIAEPF